ncbi:hypothetical protein AAU61_20580 [Desulfocarbo indianensis]|nr:hypothetical protein AAU61_20580 [Desulfocarbo indianensis]
MRVKTWLVREAKAPLMINSGSQVDVISETVEAGPSGQHFRDLRFGGDLSHQQVDAMIGHLGGIGLVQTLGINDLPSLHQFRCYLAA